MGEGSSASAAFVAGVAAAAQAVTRRANKINSGVQIMWTLFGCSCYGAALAAQRRLFG